MRFLHHLDEGRHHQQIGHGGALAEGRGDGAEELRADDAAGAPDLGDGGERQVPAEFLRRAGHHGEALRIGGDLAGEQRQFEIRDAARQPAFDRDRGPALP